MGKRPAPAADAAEEGKTAELTVGQQASLARAKLLTSRAVHAGQLTRVHVADRPYLPPSKGACAQRTA